MGQQVPVDFVFAVKISRYLTHLRRFRTRRTAAPHVEGGYAAGPTLGPVLFQQPPTFACDIGALRALLQELPAGMRAGFEFRMRAGIATMCWMRWIEPERRGAWAIPRRPHIRPPLEVTGGWTYMRFRRGTVSRLSSADAAAVV